MTMRRCDDYNFENGKERLWYAENAVGHIFFTSPMSLIPAGYVRRSTTDSKEMDRMFRRMHDQEREHNEKLLESIYSRGRDRYEAIRSRLYSRLSSVETSEAEKGIIREALKLMDNHDSKMQENTVYGVSAMEESEAPIVGERTKVM